MRKNPGSTSMVRIPKGASSRDYAISGEGRTGFSPWSEPQDRHSDYRPTSGERA